MCDTKWILTKWQGYQSQISKRSEKGILDENIENNEKISIENNEKIAYQRYAIFKNHFIMQKVKFSLDKFLFSYY